MNAVVSIVLLAAVLGVIVFLLSRRENGRRSQYGLYPFIFYVRM